MQQKTLKRALAFALAGTMTLGMSTTVFAQTGDATGTQTGTGTGSFEGHVDKDVIAVTLPTASSTTFAYKMDPEGLIAATNGAKHSGASFQEGKNVYFQSAANTWTAESEKLKVINKGTVDVDVTVAAKTAENDNVAMSTTSTFESTDKAAKLYLGLKVANKDVVAIDTTETAGKVVVGLKGNDDNFDITSTETGYEYKAKAGVPDTAWNNFEFGLTGACNPNGDYSAEDLAGSDVTVTWSYAVRAEDSSADILAENAVSDAAPSITTTSYSLTADTPVEIPVSLGGGTLGATTITKVTDVSGNAVEKGTQWTFANGKLTFTEARVNALLNAKADKAYIVHFDDTAKTKINVTLKGSGK